MEFKHKLLLVTSSFVAVSGCKTGSGERAHGDTRDEAHTSEQRPTPPPGHSNGPPLSSVFSAFGDYQALPKWSGWCGQASDPHACAKTLRAAVSADNPSEQSPKSRPAVRAHGWHLWAAIWSPLQQTGYRNDAHRQQNNLLGTTGCWMQFDDKSPACSGMYPIWLTWPNTGRPYGEAPTPTPEATEPEPSKGSHTTLRSTNRSFSRDFAQGDPNPTQKQTVNTSPAPIYALPPLVLSKHCQISNAQATAWLKSKSYNDIMQACERAGATKMICPRGGVAAICDGTAFVNQGDVMIATESLSKPGYEDIQRHKLYSESTLETMYAAKDNSVAQKIGNDYISTKHMFWPVKGCRPGVEVGEQGCRVRYGALPPWAPERFKEISYATNADYRGYETWGKVVAIDTCAGAPGTCATSEQAELALAHVSGTGFGPIKTMNPEVFRVDQFAHVQISKEVLQKYLTPVDRALLDQATIWAYGDASNGFEPGDFLIVAAMHVVTKEVDTWAFQSVWWSPRSDSIKACPLDQYNHCFGQAGAYAATEGIGSSVPSPYAGLTSAQIETIDAQVGTTWRDYYLLTDSYGIRYELDGTPVSVANYFAGQPPSWATTGPTGQPLPLLPISQNVYIEPVIHPLGTNCQNCHRRAGFPNDSCASYSSGCGRANYQTAQCADLLADYGAPATDPCMITPWANHDSRGNHCQPQDDTQCNGNEAFPVLNTDTIWIIADSHIQAARR